MNDYLILEKTKFNKFDFSQTELKQIFKDTYGISTKFKTKKLKLEDIYDNNFVKIDDVLINHKNAILIISEEVKILLFFNDLDKNHNKYHIIDFYIKNCYYLTYNYDFIKIFFNKLNDRAEIY